MHDGPLFRGAENKLFHFAKINRKSLTKAEKFLWFFLRNRKFNGVKFRRQHPIYNFIADFYCANHNLVIEIDGGYHNEKTQQEYDQGRTYELREVNVKVIRFTNEEVLNNIGFVLKEIEKHVAAVDKDKFAP